MKILNIVKYDLIKLFRDKTAMIFVVLLPVIFTLVMGFAYGAAGDAEKMFKVPVGIVNNDSGKVALDLVDELKSDKTLRIVEFKLDELQKKVENIDIEVGFIIPNNFSEKIIAGEDVEIKVIKLPSSTGFVAVEGIIASSIAKLNAKEGIQAYISEKLKGMDNNTKKLILSGIGEKVDENLQKISLVSVGNTKYSNGIKTKNFDGKLQGSIGIAIMFVMFTIILGAGEILEEKKANTWGRINITPTRKSIIILGKTLGMFLKGWVQIAFLILVGKFAMGVNWGESILNTIVVVSVYLLCITSMGMFLSTLVKTSAQLGAVSAIIIISTSMMSGCYWPIEMEPIFMQNLAQLFPQYWAIKGLTNTVSGSLGLGSSIIPILVLIAIGTIFFILSLLNGRFKVDLNKAVSLKTTSQDIL